jgi:hypothetical protein
MWNMWDLLLLSAGTAIVGVAYMPMDQKAEEKERTIYADRVELANGSGRAEITLSDSGEMMFKMWKESGARFQIQLGDPMRIIMYSKGGGVFKITKDKDRGMFASVGRGKRHVLLGRWPGLCGFVMGNAKGRFVFKLSDSKKYPDKLTVYGANEQAAFSAGANVGGGWIRTLDRNGKEMFHLGGEDVGSRTVAIHDIEGRKAFSVAVTKRAVSATMGSKGWNSEEFLEFGEDGKLHLKPVPMRKKVK